MSDNYYEQMEQVWADYYPSTNSIEESESFYREIGFKGGFTPYIDKLLTHPSLIFTKARLLEFGCDNGITLNYFNRKSLELYGVDINNQAIQNGRKLFPEFNLVRSFGIEIPFKDRFFDVVFASAVLKHIRHADRTVVYGEFSRVADYVIVSELNSAADEVEEESGFQFYHSDFITELKDFFDEVELTIIGEYFLGLYRVKP
ncbi:class I SAM-dependent methyltransferase [Chloroflexota bacterium]